MNFRSKRVIFLWLLMYLTLPILFVSLTQKVQAQEVIKPQASTSQAVVQETKGSDMAGSKDLNTQSSDEVSSLDVVFYLDSLTNYFAQQDEDIIDQTLDFSLEQLVANYRAELFTSSDCTSSFNVDLDFSDSAYIARLQRIPTIMEMSYNAIVKSCIERYAHSPERVARMVGVGETYYFPIFERSLAKYQLPFELKYLPVIESGLNPKAYSRAGAAGLWQFMTATGKSYGLEINSLVDERCDPEKASDAAARYLRRLYTIYGDWSLVIAAYNCGSGNVAKAIRHAGGSHDYWKIYPYLPRETRSYVPIFIAANYIMTYYADYGICPMQPTQTLVTDSIFVHQRMHLKQIGTVLDISLEEMRTLNPQYFYDIIPGNIKPYALVLPMDKIGEYTEQLDSIVKTEPELIARKTIAKPTQFGSGHVQHYKVKRGDTLGGIAHRYHVKVSQLKKWNRIRGTMIREGQRLKIYK